MAYLHYSALTYDVRLQGLSQMEWYFVEMLPMVFCSVHSSLMASVKHPPSGFNREFAELQSQHIYQYREHTQLHQQKRRIT